MAKGEETAVLYKILINKVEENTKSPLAYSTEILVADKSKREMLNSEDERFQRKWVDTVQQVTPNILCIHYKGTRIKLAVGKPE